MTFVAHCVLTLLQPVVLNELQLTLQQTANEKDSQSCSHLCVSGEAETLENTRNNPHIEYISSVII